MFNLDIIVAAVNRSRLASKVLRVVESCKTEKQFSIALKYVELSRLYYEPDYGKIVHAAVRDKQEELNLINRSTTCTII